MMCVFIVTNSERSVDVSVFLPAESHRHHVSLCSNDTVICRHVGWNCFTCVRFIDVYVFDMSLLSLEYSSDALLEAVCLK
jgi:hypothetical protein